MARHRTKKNRLRANERRSTQLKNQGGEKVLPSKAHSEEIFSYNPKLIVRDLRKTFLLVIFILLVLLSMALIYT